MIRFKRYGEMLLLVLFFLTFAITLTINAKWLYIFDIKTLGILDYVDLSRHELIKNYEQLMNYLNFFWVNPLEMSDFPVSEKGMVHFFEVKRLFQINYLIFSLTLVPSIILLRNKIKNLSLWLLVRPFSYLLGGLVTLLIFMALTFDTFFIKFHEAFFNNDSWVFNPMSDPVILVLPQDYFMHCFILFFILFILLISLLIYFGKRQFRLIKKREKP